MLDGFRMPVKRDDAEAALAILNRLQTESEKGKHTVSWCSFFSDVSDSPVALAATDDFKKIFAGPEIMKKVKV